MRKLTWILFLAFLLIATPVAATTPFTSKPALGASINWSHPLSRGLVAVFLMNEGGGTIVKNLASYQNGLLSTHFFINNGISCNGVSGYADLKTNSRLNNLAPLSYVALINPINAGEGNLGCILTKTTASSSVPPKRFRLGYESATTSDLALTMEAGATDLTVVAAGVIPHRKQSFVVATWDGINGAGVNLYVNGNKQSVSVTEPGGAIVDDSTHNYYAGAAGTSGAGTFNGFIYFIYIYSRALSPSEIQQIYIEPYCFIEYKPWTMWGATVAAARRIFMVH